jgi:hypothetical protein
MLASYIHVSHPPQSLNFFGRVWLLDVYHSLKTELKAPLLLITNTLGWDRIDSPTTACDTFKTAFHERTGTNSAICTISNRMAKRSGQIITSMPVVFLRDNKSSLIIKHHLQQSSDMK